MLHHFAHIQDYIDELVQERRYTFANALELRFLALTHRHDVPIWNPELVYDSGISSALSM